MRRRTAGELAVIAVVLAACWFAYGSPARTVAGLLWPGDAAPWEKVDVTYYPNRADRTRRASELGLPSVGACRAAVLGMAQRYRDPAMTVGAYECGIGRIAEGSGAVAYRRTVQ